MNGNTPVKPRRPLRNDLYSLAVVMTVPLAVAIAFPYSAIGFSATKKSVATPKCAFVQLDASLENQAIENARSAWKNNISADAIDDLQELSLTAITIPDDGIKSTISIEERTMNSSDRIEPYDVIALPPTMAAGKAQSLPEMAAVEELATFPKSEMLRIDFKQ